MLKLIPYPPAPWRPTQDVHLLPIGHNRLPQGTPGTEGYQEPEEGRFPLRYCEASQIGLARQSGRSQAPYFEEVAIYKWSPVQRCYLFMERVS